MVDYRVSVTITFAGQDWTGQDLKANKTKAKLWKNVEVSSYFSGLIVFT